MSTTSPTPAPEVDPTASAVALDRDGDDASGVQALLRTAANAASLRAIVVLAIIWVIFTVANDRFLTAGNLTNLTLQVAATGTISVGVVLVLLLGEIDLSVGAVSGLAGAIMGVLSVQHGWNGWLAIAVALAAGAGIGLLQGSIVTWLGIPSFVITLAGLLTWQGFQLKTLGDAGSLNVTDPVITNLANTFLAEWLAWTVALVAIGLMAAGALVARQRRSAAGLELEPMLLTGVRLGAIAIAIVVAVYVVNQDRGVPVSVIILIGLVVIFDALITRTRYGRHVLAAGGNEEATRRAGIATRRVKTVVFVLASTMAAAGGVLAASRALAVNQSSGSGDVLLLAIAGPVIAGVSLFGGRGSVWAALLGALVIGSISNGMDLLGLESSVKFIITGGVLAAAVVLDALARKQRMSQGRS
ncbi:ribose transport system permease protein RbsC [Patulibacter medicamentivorans]|uniref:Xylose transport system permease protein XylH n=1 Tax=Patulibacter medicamentivorans TaxID=1097667 RepID=H0E632_9ACTN|nr:ABC transporter permease [Patulibacter medicamentivorans]EHN10861.1 ribose transport system permease protein RbsC [Patulibacter medicamentivorans]